MLLFNMDGGFLMKYRNKGNYYIRNLVSENTGRIDQYYFENKSCNLDHILEEMCYDIGSLLQQYPGATDIEEINRLRDIAYYQAKNLCVNPEYCYHYFGREQFKFQGITVCNLEESGLFLMKMTTNLGNDYQRRVDFIYDMEESLLYPNRVVEVERREGIAIQNSFSPKGLRKKKNYIHY